jgi:hypothetical protein
VSQENDVFPRCALFHGERGQSQNRVQGHLGRLRWTGRDTELWVGDPRRFGRSRRRRPWASAAVDCGARLRWAGPVLRQAGFNWCEQRHPRRPECAQYRAQMWPRRRQLEHFQPVWRVILAVKNESGGEDRLHQQRGMRGTAPRKPRPKQAQTPARRTKTSGSRMPRRLRKEGHGERCCTASEGRVARTAKSLRPPYLASQQ